jgi:hypothetical protein
MVAKRKTPARVASPVRVVDFPENARTMPATQGMLVLVRDELKHLIAAPEERVTAKIVETNARLDRVEARLDAQDAKLEAFKRHFDARLDAQDAKIEAFMHRVEAALEEQRAFVTRILALAEEQRSHSAVAIEAITLMIGRQDRQEKRTNELEELVYAFVRGQRKNNP